MSYRLLVSDLAKADIRGIRDYFINQLFNPDAADDLIDKIKWKVSFLVDTPRMHQECNGDDGEPLDLRCFAVANYLVFCAVRDVDSTVEIQRVLYRGRAVRRGLFNR